MGANQLDKPTSRAIFFNWYFFSVYTASVVSVTVIVYVEDNLGWKWGFGIGVIANLIGLATFVSGTRFYCFDKPKGSPFVGLARVVVVAATRKRNLKISSESKDYYYHGDQGMTDMAIATPSKNFRYVHTCILFLFR
jgi:peptide/histidine transporter 3/4